MIKLAKSTCYALHAAIEMARLPVDGQITAAEVAARHDIPPTVLAKVFQRLVRAGLAVSVRGAGGGYRLARAPASLTVLDVMRIFEPPSESAGGWCGTDGLHGRADPRLERLLDEVDELARNTFASVSLKTLSQPHRL